MPRYRRSEREIYWFTSVKPHNFKRASDFFDGAANSTNQFNSIYSDYNQILICFFQNMTTQSIEIGLFHTSISPGEDCQIIQQPANTRDLVLFKRYRPTDSLTFEFR